MVTAICCVEPVEPLDTLPFMFICDISLRSTVELIASPYFSKASFKTKVTASAWMVEFESLSLSILTGTASSRYPFSCETSALTAAWFPDLASPTEH
ncbi:MAG: hypothetical protein E6K93_01520 [Thaumarchaeota archaeon]|nr:MAG: hypothetical protein E6K93_01520 [Nitrososphaerota archaeon]